VRCAWCDRIQVVDRFLPIDPALIADLADRTTHGICPECFEREIARAVAARRADAA